ncbi:hypothetical protein [uncultured Bacteroides sp.]|uniref:hypothetical protein n=1 Tax=uncultured Bacteroides sp. TaxID=162156 RepID=UPI002AABE2AD|nr:hypothetical protein [uncultured Bacteroides sp.]
MTTKDLLEFQKLIKAKENETVLVLKMGDKTNAYIFAYTYDEVGEHCITDTQGERLINLDQVITIEAGSADNGCEEI